MEMMETGDAEQSWFFFFFLFKPARISEALFIFIFLRQQGLNLKNVLHEDWMESKNFAGHLQHVFFFYRDGIDK